MFFTSCPYLFDSAFAVIPHFLQDPPLLMLLTSNTILISSCLYGLILARYHIQ